MNTNIKKVLLIFGGGLVLYWAFKKIKPIGGSKKSTKSTKWEKPTGKHAWEYQAGGTELKSEDTEKVTADVQGAKLKQMLAGIKKG